MKAATRAAPAVSLPALRVAIRSLPWWTGPVGVTLGFLASYIVAALVVHPGPTVPTDPIYVPPSAIPHQPTGLDPLLHWDGGWYLRIVEVGYRSVPGTLQQPSNFFPLFPAVVVGLHRAIPWLSVFAAGVLANVAATCAAMCLVDRVVADWPRRQRLMLVALLVSLPGAFFYATFYSEALFIFAVALTMWGLSAPGRMWWAPLGIALATADRAVGILLLIPLVAMLAGRERRPWRAMLMVAAACSGAVAVLVVDQVMAGSWHAFYDAHRGWTDHPITMGLRTTLHIFKLQMLLRPGYDPVVALGLWIAALTPVAILATVRWRPWLAAWAAAAYVASMLTGGYPSAARYLIVLLPVWIGAVALLRRFVIAWRAIGVVIAAGLVVNLALVDRFVGWRWAG